MISKLIATVLITSVLTTQTVVADVWQDIGGYKYGDEPNPCEKAEALLQETGAEQYPPIEDKLIGVLTSKTSTQDGKSIACRFLQQVGTERCIPAVSALLDDEILCHYARLVLERLECEPADKAMREALLNVPDSAKVGILGSLGVRRDGSSVGRVRKLTTSQNPGVAAAAIEALGKIGGPEAAKYLLFMPVTPPKKKLQSARMKAMVACARTLDSAGAVALCERVLAGPDMPSRTAALRQLTIADAERAFAFIAKALKGDDAKMRQSAINVVAETKDRKLTVAMTGLLEQLPRGRKAELIVALGTRGDTAALNAVSRYVDSEDTTIRRAAVKAVGKLGDAGVVKLLLEAADSPDMSATVTRAVVGMKGDRINAVLVESLARESLRKPAIKVCMARGCTEAVPALLKLTQDRNSDVRQDAWAGVGALAGDDHIEAVMDIVLGIKDSADLARAAAAVKAIFSHADDRSKCFKAVAARYPQAAPETRIVILELGAAIGDSDALKLQRSALRSPDKKLSGAALRVLAKWPNESAAADLLELAGNASEAVDRIVALRGYIRIAGLNAARLSATERVEMLKTAMILAARSEEKKQVMGALQNIKSIESLKMLEQYLDDPALRTEAQMSAANLVWDMRRRHPAEVTAIARKLAASDNRTVSQKANRTLKDLGKNK
ncbi:MAG: HEAT repeat domain-containing protein [Phycisphaerales bacterium]|nr:MAG: HEAT repeat domain-containing protein [Phycisphaerales bacterium]